MAKRKIPFDYFSLPVRGFNIKGQESSKSWLGFVFTLGLFGLVMGVFISELVSMFRRDTLTVSISEEGLPNPPPTNLKNILMAFAVTNRVSPLIPLTHNVDFNIQAEMLTWRFFGANPRQLSVTPQALTIKKCDPSYFGDYLEEVSKKTNVNDIFCIPRDQNDELFTIEGQVGSDTYKELHIGIYCGAVGATTCPPSFTTSNILFMYAVSSLDTSNYENPVSLAPTAIVERADRASYHEKIIQIAPREIITDKGLIFSELETQTDIVVSEGRSLIEGVNYLIPQVFGFRIQMGQNKVIVNRSYKMILDVFASTTGIASTIAFVVAIIIKPYIEQKTHNDVMKTISPEKFVELRFRDYVKAVIGNKAARQKVEKTEEEKEWITQNLDMIRLMKSWGDLEKIKKLVLIEEQMEVQDVHDMSSCALDKTRSFLNNSVNTSQVHPK